MENEIEKQAKDKIEAIVAPIARAEGLRYRAICIATENGGVLLSCTAILFADSPEHDKVCIRFDSSIDNVTEVSYIHDDGFVTVDETARLNHHNNIAYGAAIQKMIEKLKNAK